MAESMTEDRWQSGYQLAPVPEPEHPNLRPDGRDPRPENGSPSQSSGLPL